MRTFHMGRHTLALCVAALSTSALVASGQPSQVAGTEPEKPLPVAGISSNGAGPNGGGAITSAERVSLLATHRAQLRTPVANGSGYFARNPGQAMTARFEPSGVVMRSRSDDWSWGLKLAGWGYAERGLRAVEDVAPAADGSQVQYRYGGGLTEWWDNSEGGFQHGFTVEQPPHTTTASPGTSGTLGLLAFDLSIGGGLVPKVSADGKSVQFLSPYGEEELSYSGLVAFDADGKPLDAHIVAGGAGLRILVDDLDARYPLLVDPFVQNTCVQQEIFLKAPNPDIFDYYGWSVAISGDTVVVGAQKEDSDVTGVATPNGDEDDSMGLLDDGFNSGAAYVYVRTCNGSSPHWELQAYLKPDTQFSKGYYFGEAVAIDGDILFVGAPQAIERRATDPALLGPAGAGDVYAFERVASPTGPVWEARGSIGANGPATLGNLDLGDRFGTSIAISGDRLVVGVPEEDSNATTVGGNETNDIALAAGAAFVYTWTLNGALINFSQEAYLKPLNASRGDRFGWAVDIDGDLVVVGAEYKIVSGVNRAGAAYVFEWSNPTGGGFAWSQVDQLTRTEGPQAVYPPQPEGFFGSSVAIDGENIVVGAWGEPLTISQNSSGEEPPSDLSGAVYYYERLSATSTDWDLIQRVVATSDPSLTTDDEHFGFAVALLGDRLVVGARTEESGNGNPLDDSADSAGALYVFHRISSGKWTRFPEYVKARHPGERDFFGRTVAMTANTIVTGGVGQASPAAGVGALEMTTGVGMGSNPVKREVGAAWVYMLDPLEISNVVTACTPDTNSTVQQGTLRAYGDLDPDCNRVVLVASNLPLGQPGTFHVSNSLSGTLLGNCLGGPIMDYTPQDLFSNGVGTMSATIDLDEAPGLSAILSGSTWFFNASYSDSFFGFPITLYTETIAIVF